MNNTIIKNAFLNSFLAALYVSVIGSFLFYLPEIFPQLQEKPDTVFAPIMMLMLLVFSVAMMGMLIFGRPVLWYLDGKKKEAVSLFLYTLSFFFILMILAFLVLVTTVA